MSDTVKRINRYFKSAIKSDIDNLLSKILLSERQEKIFEMYFIKKNDIGYIADTLFVSVSVINCELRVIREKIERVILN